MKRVNRKPIMNSIKVNQLKYLSKYTQQLYAAHTSHRATLHPG